MVLNGGAQQRHRRGKNLQTGYGTSRIVNTIRGVTVLATIIGVVATSAQDRIVINETTTLSVTTQDIIAQAPVPGMKIVGTERENIPWASQPISAF